MLDKLLKSQEYFIFGGIGTGIGKNWYQKQSRNRYQKFWYRKKSRNRYWKKLVPETVSEPVSKKLVPEKSLGTGIGKFWYWKKSRNRYLSNLEDFFNVAILVTIMVN